MDKKKGILNVSVAITQKFAILVTGLIVRRCLINYIGNDVNGLNSLYASIIGFLAVTEAGIGTAITFCMYKPIIDNDIAKVSGLYELIRKLYIGVGAFIGIAGIGVTFFLPYFAADYSQLNVNLSLTFLLALISTVMTYAYSSKISLINAYKNNYIATSITTLGTLIGLLLQIITLRAFHSFEIYLICTIIGNTVTWAATEWVIRRKYNSVVTLHSALDVETKHDVAKNIKAMFMHKFGMVLSNTADSVIISAFIGVVALGGYTNYNIIINNLIAIIGLFFTPLTSVIGHMYAEGNNETSEKYYNFLYGFNFVIGVVFCLGYFAIIDNLVTLIFGPNLELSKSISFIITLNQFTQFMRKATMTFRDATGTFYNDRWKPVAEGISNIILSIIFVLILPDDLKLVGVIIATIITNLLICHIVEPYVLYKYAFKKSPNKFYLKNYSYILGFGVALWVLRILMANMSNEWLELLVNGVISVCISAILGLFVFITDRDFRNQVFLLLKKFKH